MMAQHGVDALELRPMVWKGGTILQNLALIAWRDSDGR